VLTSGDEADVLVCFYQHSYDAHIGALRDGGICIYDSTATNVEMDAVTTLKHERGIQHIPLPIYAGHH
jgi:2-oxoglutarate/2-oxoacid ferredoxin oxidoreductase subunit alpha